MGRSVNLEAVSIKELKKIQRERPRQEHINSTKDSKVKFHPHD